jgi:methylmalonyl-CoA mutase
MYAVRPWTIRQYAGFSTAEASNAFYRKGAGRRWSGRLGGFWTWRRTAVTTPTIRASPATSARAGVAIDSVEDMKILFDGIPLDKISVSMTMKRCPCCRFSPAISLPPKSRACRRTSSRGTIQNDILKEFMVPQHLHLSAEAVDEDHRRHHWLHGKTTCRSSTRSPFRVITCRRAGATQALELAFTLADGRDYVKTAIASGLDVDFFAGRLSFFFAIGMNFYLEVAQAARRPPAVVEDHAGVFAEESEVDDAAHPLPDLRLVADRTGTPTTTS